MILPKLYLCLHSTNLVLTGTSDPYVRCFQGQEKLFQTKTITKTVNPVWQETFASYVDNPFKELELHVYDYDLVGSDDFMGGSTLDLTGLTLRK